MVKLKSSLFSITCLLLSVVLLSGCSAQWHLRKAVRKDPTLLYGQTKVWDTIIQTRERRLVDTLELYRDTTIYQDRVRLELRYLPGKTIMVTATCPSDTIIITKTIEPDVMVIKQKKPFGYSLLAIICVLIAAWGLYRNR